MSWSVFYTSHRHLNYCCQVWAQNGNHHINKILSLQKSALRIISFKPFRSDVSTLYSDLKIICFKNAIKIANLLFVFDSLKNNFLFMLIMEN